MDQKQQRDAGAPPDTAGSGDTLRYRLGSEVPDYWVPLLPVKAGDGLRLKRGAVLKLNGATEQVPAMGRILENRDKNWHCLKRRCLAKECE